MLLSAKRGSSLVRVDVGTAVAALTEEFLLP